MSFKGDLEDLPIVDVIQLMHNTRNSGILYIKGRKGQSELVFKGGYIVGASHLNNSLRIGEILVAHNYLSEEALAEALNAQSGSGEERKPLIVTLIEKGLIDEQDAYMGLRALIELVLIDVLTWQSGTFILEPAREAAVDTFAYYPQEIEREINVDVQGILMDALRVFDEKLRDGEIVLEEDLEDTEALEGLEELEELEEDSSGPDITADLLGLDNLDDLDKKIRGVHAALVDTAGDSDRGKVKEGKATAIPVGPKKASQPESKEPSIVRQLNEFIGRLPEFKSTPEMATAMLKFVAIVFERTLTLVLHNGELIAEKSVGIKVPKDQGASGPLGFRIQLDDNAMIGRAVKMGNLQYGIADDNIGIALYDKIGPPANKSMLLLPIKRHGKTVFMIYADFGSSEPADVQIELFEMLADQAGLALECGF
ncbi:MAG: hypothetical protein C0623_06885 [Desulfuromonas sp.]|nr:MAG: hypothetical protein C0623_06885 [Desulfuromonas sp.]